MSSSFAVAKQGFKERMGRAHATLDEQFTASWNNCQQLEELVDRMGRHMREYVAGIRTMVVSGHAVSDDFKTFYERQPERLTSIATRYELIQQGFRTDKLALLERLVQQNVFLRMQEFKVELAGLRSKVGDREVARKRYDHYLAKITELREGRSKAKAKGKELSVSELDKLTRNEKKFEDARLEYVAINRLVARSLWVTWSRRFQILDPIYAEILKIKANFTQALSNQLQTIIPPLKVQMAIPLREEPLPAVFAPQGKPVVGSAVQAVHGGHDSGAGLEDMDDHDGHGVMSPGGTQQMDARALSARMQAATEKLNVDAALAQRKAAEKHARANVKASGGVVAAGSVRAADLADGASDEEDEVAAAAARRAAAAAKAKKAATVGGVVAPGGPRAGAVKKSAAQSPPPEEDDDEEDESEDGVDDDSDEDEEERARRARKAAKKEKARAKERAAAAAAASSGKPKKATHAESNSLDFLGDLMMASSVSAAPAAVAAAPAARSKSAKGAKAAPVDLLAFSPVKAPASNGPVDIFGAAAAAPKPRSKQLELDSFFGAAPAPAPAQAFSPGVAAANSSPLDPFADLPHAESAGPVDLLAVPPQQPAASSYQPQHTSDPIYNPNFPNGIPPGAGAGAAPSYGRAPSLTPGAPGNAGLDDPFFSTPLPLPTSITPKGPGAAATKKPAAAKKAASRSFAHSSSSEVSSSSEESETSDSEQEEGRAPTKKSVKAPAAKKPAAVPVAAAPNALQPSSNTPVETSDDPFDFAANPTPSQREAAVAGAGQAQPAKKVAAPPQTAAPRPVVNPQAAALASLSDPSPHGPPVPALPRGGLPDMHMAPAAAASAAAAAASAGRPAVTPISAQSPGGPPQSPEDYSPTRQEYDPFAGRAKKPADDDPLGAVNDDTFGGEDW